MASEISTPHSFRDSLVSLRTSAPAGSLLAMQSQCSQPARTDVEISAHRQSTSALASPHQWEAIKFLCNIDTCIVLAWLTGLKFSAYVSTEYFQPGSLSSQHYAALSALKDCPNSLILAWLDRARRMGVQASGAVDKQRSAVTSTPSISQRLPSNCLDSAFQSSASSLSQSTPYTYRNSHSLCSPIISVLDASSDRSIGVEHHVSLVPSSHSHGCPLCKKDKIIGTCGGWKRHMKEHETIYWCVYCTRLESGKSKTYTRRVNLVRHLQTAHGISGGAPLADEWRKPIEKKYFGCGFCISLFTSMTEQLNHIDDEHFKHQQSIDHWNWNNVVRGLLLQPEVNEIWRSTLGIYSTNQSIVWDASVIKGVQLQLELSEDNPLVLASAAIDKVSWDLQNIAQTNTASFNGGANQPRQKSRNIATTVHERSLLPQYPTVGPCLATLRDINNGQHKPDCRDETTWRVPDWPHYREPHDSQPHKASSTTYQERNHGTGSPFQSEPVEGWALPPNVPYSPWLGPFANGDHGHIATPCNSTSAVEWQSLLFPEPSNLTLQPMTSEPVYLPGSNIHSTNTTESGLLISHATPSATFKGLSSSTRPDVRSPSFQARR